VSLVVVAALLLSYVNLLYPDFWLPLNIHVVPAAMAYFFLGYLLRKTAVEGKLLLFAWAGSLAALVLVLLGVDVEQDLKYTVYGIPFVSVALALSLILAFMHLSFYVARAKIIGPVLASLGRYSMGIMFLHMPIAYAMRALPEHSETVRLIVAFSLSYAIAWGMDRFALTRSLFLGAAQPVAPEVRKTVSAVT
jgi:fucose 4-O-acetylase-like acetyltransferase